MAACEGIRHEFHFRIRLLGPSLALDAFELQDQAPAGYQFQMLGEPDDDVFALLERLVEKIRRGLSIKYLTVVANRPQIAKNAVVGRFEWDEAEDGEIPLVVLDGSKEMSWSDFGRMLTTFEGFQFKLQIGERSDEL